MYTSGGILILPQMCTSETIFGESVLSFHHESWFWGSTQRVRLAREAPPSPTELSHQPFDLIFEVLADFSNIKKIPLNSRNTQFSNSLTWKTWWSFMAYDFWIGLEVFIVVEHLPFIHPTPASLRHFKIKD